MTAAAHLALTHEDILHCDFDTPLMFTSDPVKGGISYEHGGLIQMTTTPGLGATIDETVLRGAEKAII
jgi:L-alanine-DL-glutamate epimerase-like enolase superfamily enzyme